MKYWAMRTSKKHQKMLFDELRQDRMRQGWGYCAEQYLRLISAKISRGDPLTPDEKWAWRNRVMLGGRYGINPEDVVLMPNMPENSSFTLVRVTGSYFFDMLRLGDDQDFGHVLPVKVLGKFQNSDARIHAPLRGSLRCQSRVWSLEPYKENLSELVRFAEQGEIELIDWDFESALDTSYKRAFDGVRTQWQKEFAEPRSRRRR